MFISSSSHKFFKSFFNDENVFLHFDTTCRILHFSVCKLYSKCEFYFLIQVIPFRKWRGSSLSVILCLPIASLAHPTNRNWTSKTLKKLTKEPINAPLPTPQGHRKPIPSSSRWENISLSAPQTHNVIIKVRERNLKCTANHTAIDKARERIFKCTANPYRHRQG